MRLQLTGQSPAAERDPLGRHLRRCYLEHKHLC